jgi:hypothetical protein
VGHAGSVLAKPATGPHGEGGGVGAGVPEHAFIIALNSPPFGHPQMPVIESITRGESQLLVFADPDPDPDPAGGVADAG